LYNTLILCYVSDNYFTFCKVGDSVSHLAVGQPLVFSQTHCSAWTSTCISKL